MKLCQGLVRRLPSPGQNSADKLSTMSLILKSLASLLAALVLVLGTGAYAASNAEVRYLALATDAGAVRLAYRDSGKGQPIVLLHGFGASSYTWRHVEPELVKWGYRVLTVDLKGFGLSDKPPDEKYSIFNQAELISAFIRQLQLKDATIIGHSLGGGVALVLALDDNPDVRSRISKLVLIDSIAYSQNIPIAFNILRTPVLGQIGSRIVPIEVQTRVALKLAFFDDSKFNDEDVKEYANALRDKGSRHAMIQTARQIMPENLPELSSRYRSIQVPTLIVWCDHDKVIKPNIGLRLHNNLPNSTFRVIRDCGHLPHEEKPHETLRALQVFLKP